MIVFLMGFVLAIFRGGKKKRISYAKIILAQLPNEFIEKLIRIFLAFNNKDIKKVNNIVATISQNELDRFAHLVGPDNRPQEFSSGEFGNYLSWEVNKKHLIESGYTTNSARILTEIILYDIGDVLLILSKKKNIVE